MVCYQCYMNELPLIYTLAYFAETSLKKFIDALGKNGLLWIGSNALLKKLPSSAIHMIVEFFY